MCTKGILLGNGALWTMYIADSRGYRHLHLLHTSPPFAGFKPLAYSISGRHQGKLHQGGGVELGPHPPYIHPPSLIPANPSSPQSLIPSPIPSIAISIPNALSPISIPRQKGFNRGFNLPLAASEKKSADPLRLCLETAHLRVEALKYKGRGKTNVFTRCCMRFRRGWFNKGQRH